MKSFALTAFTLLSLGFAFVGNADARDGCVKKPGGEFCTPTVNKKSPYVNPETYRNKQNIPNSAAAASNAARPSTSTVTTTKVPYSQMTKAQQAQQIKAQQCWSGQKSKCN